MNIPKMVLFDIDYTLFKTKEFKESRLVTYSLYEEVLDVLIELGKFVKLGIISEGEEDFQKNKLIKTGIINHFEKKHVHVVGEKDKTIAEILEKYKEYLLYIIDDKLPILYSAKKIMPSVFAIWVKRGPFADNQKEIKDFVPDAVIGNLGEITEIIKYGKKK